jgi:hypothetical protein
MTTFARTTLIVALALGLSSLAQAAGGAGKFDATPQVKVYRAACAAMKAGDYETYKKLMIKEAGPQMDKQIKEMGKTPKETLQFMYSLQPADMTFTSVKVEGSKATLMATGKVDGEVNKGTIEMALEDGQWKVGKQSWTNAK